VVDLSPGKGEGSEQREGQPCESGPMHETKNASAQEKFPARFSMLSVEPDARRRSYLAELETR
jgi:hypothetical protein